ncbi:MAG: MFS transporter [Thermoguttaceae bacterium]
MKRIIALLAALLAPPKLPPEARRTFRFHLAYAVLDAAAGGILLNAPLVAIKEIGASNWQLPMRELYSGAGMLLTLYLGCWMARRRKMPFVLIPGLLCGLFSLGMALTMWSALVFLTFFSLSAMLEIIARAAIATILRNNYPVAQRGAATGEVRKWSSLVFVTSILSSAYLLQRAGSQAIDMALAQVLLAAVLSLSSFLCFCRVRDREDPETLRHDLRPEVLDNLRAAARVVARDGRFRRYLLGCAVDGFCGMLYFPLIVAFFSRTLGFDYFRTAALVHAIPAGVAFLATGWLGRWFDRSNPWVAWAWVRFAWGLDALLVAAALPLGRVAPRAVSALPLLGRVLRGSVQGGQWLLWWQIGVTHFAPPGEDTSRYLGIMAFLNGLLRLLASAAGMILASRGVSPATLLTVGGLGVLGSGVYSLAQAARERREHQPETMAEFEGRFQKG